MQRRRKGGEEGAYVYHGSYKHTYYIYNHVLSISSQRENLGVIWSSSSSSSNNNNNNNNNNRKATAKEEDKETGPSGRVGLCCFGPVLVCLFIRFSPVLVCLFVRFSPALVCLFVRFSPALVCLFVLFSPALVCLFVRFSPALVCLFQLCCSPVLLLFRLRFAVFGFFCARSLLPFFCSTRRALRSFLFLFFSSHNFPLKKKENRTKKKKNGKKERKKEKKTPRINRGPPFHGRRSPAFSSPFFFPCLWRALLRNSQLDSSGLHCLLSP